MEKQGLVVLRIKRGEQLSIDLAELVWLKGNPYVRVKPDLGGAQQAIGCS